MTPRVSVGLVAVCWIVCSTSLFAGEDAARDERILRAAGIATDDRSLLDFFRSQTADAATLRRARQLIEQLGSDSFPIRERAGDDLTALGPLVLPSLHQTIRQTADLEVRRRSHDAAQQLQSRWPPALAAAVAHLLGLRKPSGTVETLLAFLPGPYEESVGEEIQNTLIAVAHAHPAIHPVFVRALSSTEPARRTAAAVTLCRLDMGEYRPALRKLLRDPEASVRWQIGRELAITGDRQAVPVLIDLLPHLPAEEVEQVEELLYRLAGPKAPPIMLGRDAAAQQKCRDAWRAWWRDHGEHVDMAALKDRERQLGYTLLVLLHDNRVVEWDRDDKPRWQINGLAAPLDAEVLAGRRVLIAEYETKRVSERNFQGAILWEKKMTEPPIHAQRLPDGRTFIATRKQLLEVDRSGSRENVHYRSDAGNIITARRFRDGRIGCIEKGSYFELSAAGEEQRRFTVPPGVFTTNALTLLPNGHLLIAAYGGGTVQEYNRSGKVVWEVQMGRPLCALRLPSGHTLVSSQDMVLVEFDRSGKEIARRAALGHPCQISHR
ncbi:MAG TPA: HEAT repeat domain-containing protein [Gemmataceae bacterium]|nr:HEAT repeat domain-containing protein [Gemmataceae bacterium]